MTKPENPKDGMKLLNRFADDFLAKLRLPQILETEETEAVARLANAVDMMVKMQPELVPGLCATLLYRLLKSEQTKAQESEHNDEQ